MIVCSRTFSITTKHKHISKAVCFRLQVKHTNPNNNSVNYYSLVQFSQLLSGLMFSPKDECSLLSKCCEYLYLEAMANVNINTVVILHTLNQCQKNISCWCNIRLVMTRAIHFRQWTVVVETCVRLRNLRFSQRCRWRPKSSWYPEPCYTSKRLQSSSLIWLWSTVKCVSSEASLSTWAQ